jgi:PAS domain S-box-containing protein
VEEENMPNSGKPSSKKKNEVSLASIFNAITDGISVIDKNCNILYINLSTTHFYGYGDPVELIGKKCYKIFRYKNKKCKDCPAMMVFESGKPEHIFTSGSDSHGTEVYWEIYFYPIYDNSGNVKHVVEYTRNITREKALEKQVEESEEKLSELITVSRDVIVEYDEKLKLSFVSQNVEDFLGYTAEEILGEKNFLDLVTEESKKKIMDNYKLRMSGKSIPSLMEYDVIHKNGEIIPIETTVTLKKENGKIIGGVASLRNVSERKKTQDALKESEELYRTLVETSPDGIVLTDMDTNIIMVNQSSCDTLGYKSPKEVIGMVVFDLMAKEDQPRILSYISGILETGKVRNAEFNFVHKDGRYIPIEFNASLIYDNKGEPKAFMGISRNISERKKGEEQIRLANERLQYLLSSTSAVIYTAEAKGSYGATFLSENVKQMTGYKSKDFITKSNFWIDHVHPDDRKRVLKSIPHIFKKDTYSYNYRFRCKNGRYIWVRDEMKLTRDQDGEPLEIVGFWIDITEQMEAEESLKESQEKYSNLYQKSHDAIIIHDLKGNILDANQKAYNLFGLSKKKLLKLKISDLHPPDALKKSKKAFNSIAKKGSVNFEIEFKNKKGDIFPTEVSSSIFEIGGIKVVQGIIRDITERKKAEAALKESEELYRLLVETSPDAITMTDLEGKITYASTHTLKLHGAKKPKDLLGKNAFDLIAPEDQERAIKNLTNTLKKGVARNLEYTLLKKDGSRFMGEMNAALVKDSLGNPKAFIGTTRDITARKKSEENLRYRLEFEEIITTFSTHFINIKTNEIDDAIILALKKIGVFAKVDRSFVLLLHDNKKKISNTHEWCAPGIKSKMGLFTDLDIGILKWGMNRLKKLYPLDIPNITALPKEANTEIKLLKKAQIKSIIAVPIVIGGAFYGILGFDSVKNKRKWTDDTISVLQVASEIFANTLERKRIEETARESEEKFKSLAEKSPNMIFINQNREIVYANEACEIMMGYKRSELYSPDFNFMTLIAPESIGKVKKSFTKHMKGKEVPPYEYTILKKDGSRIESIISTKLIKYEGEPAILGIVTDISERKAVEDEMKKLKEFNESIVESMAEGIMILDEDGLVTFINPKIEELLGYKSSEILGTHWEKRLASDYRRRMRDTYSENLQGEQDRFEGVLMKKNKTELPVLISASPQIKENVFKGVLIVITNITDQKKEHFAREELMKYKIKRGSSYLVEEKVLDRAKNVVTELYKNHFDGIIITREHPEKIKSEININVPIYWMTNDPKDKASVKPQFSLLEKIIDDTIDRNTFVFLDRFDYIVTQNSFKEALNFIQHLNEIFYSRRAILIISLDPNTLSAQELSLLEKETSVIEIKQEERLSADLIDILEFVNKFNRVGEHPSYSQVGDEFKITRTTARKRIRDLVDKGLISERKSGRFKYLVITDKGKEYL